ncbi:MAG: GUN4 domain-containing protein [Xenococcaceae cyanobacterium]
MKKLLLTLVLTFLPVSVVEAQLQTSPAPTSDSDLISSETGVDYTPLRNLLAAEQWKKADEETFIVMLKVMSRSQGQFLCTDLQTIDQLWLQYSNWRFGFSVQKRIYQNLGGTKEYDQEIWEAFGDRVGWRENDDWRYYNQLTFNLSAKEGHLPAGRDRRQLYHALITESLMALETCDL